MRYLSVCSGIEAASVAWKPLGWDAVAFAEIEPFPCSVLAHHYPDVPNHGDMTRFKEWPDASVDVVVGGTPCQSFSVAGLRKGLDDPRGNLTLTYLGVVARYRPRWTVWENVPGVLSDSTGAFASFVGGLGELGYGWAYRILDGQFFGIPQRRRRVFVVGHLGDWRCAAAVLFERESLCGHPAPRREAGKGVAGSLTNRARVGGGLRTDFDCSGGVVAIRTDQTGANGHGLAENVAHALDSKVQSVACTLPSSDGGVSSGMHPVIPIDMRQASRGDKMTNNRPNGSSGGPPGTGISEAGDPSPMIAESHIPAIAFQERGRDGERNLEYQEEQAYALRAISGGGCGDWMRVTHRTAVRRLTPMECERLQGFPDAYTLVPHRGKPAADGPRYKSLGNSMAVPVMRWIGERIAFVDTIKDTPNESLADS